MSLHAVIFDLDGVITDTAEFHYRAWQRLADEEGLTFDRAINEQLRGVSRRESLDIILAGRDVDETAIETMMARKNGYYVEMLGDITPNDLLPNVANLLEQLDAVGIPYALGSASKNARTVLDALGITDRFAFIADGNAPVRKKPAPDLFRYAAAKMGVLPACTVVVEDAASGVVAAQTAGMPVLAIGDADRFGRLLHAPRTTHHPDLQNITPTSLAQLIDLDPLWNISQTHFDPTTQHHLETVMTCGNGYFSSRGVFEEGVAKESRTTFAHGIWDDMPVSFTELVNLPDWMDVEISVNGTPFRLDQGEIVHFSRTLDVQRGILQRDVRWRAPDQTLLDLHFERIICHNNDHIGLSCILITLVSEPDTVTEPVEVTIKSGINGNIANQNLLHWNHLAQGDDFLLSETRQTGIQLATAMRVVSSAPAHSCQNCPNHPRTISTQTLAVGQTMQVDKQVAFVSSRDDGLRDADLIAAARQHANACDYDSLRDGHIAAWRNVWATGDIEISGDDEAQIAVRHALYQLHVAAPQHDQRVSMGAKTLSGYGYRHHVFWDNEIFVIPYFTYTHPHLAKNMLLYRYHTLNGARKKAAGNGFEGAQFAWESAETGEEMTPTWVPHFSDKTKLVRIWTGDIQIHISADIAYALRQYHTVTGDNTFMRDYCAEIILETARFWGSRVEREESADGHRYAIRDVIGPDEYHDHVDNNTFTNRMCQWHLEYAFDILDWLQTNYPAKHQQLITDLPITENTLAHWQDVIDNLILHFDPDTKLMTQFDDFFERKYIDLSEYEGRTESMQVILGIEGANEAQVLKQADVVMLMCLHRDDYDAQTWAVNYDTYMPRTDHSYGSSLSPSFHAWAAAEMNRIDDAYDHFMLAARADISNIRGNANDGIHAASAGGLWQAAVFGFAGLRLTPDGYTLNPRLPKHWTRLAFTILHNGQPQRIVVQP